ncbi:3-phosphoshikimate 1-carboxyvinyltransferase [Humidisolicoccus flavus]|uniref:3-phosphoshikimate 1-carboxyvinyltransferase n=1 Tax=Humidisolicoccus flavus TaxID=3111414 RepID=UPI00324C6D3A
MNPSAHSAESQNDGSWHAPVAHERLAAQLHLPASKSLTNRELVLAALADGPSLLRSPLHSRDSALMVEALRALGATITEVPGSGKFGADLEVGPISDSGDAFIDCGLAGTAMRFLPQLAALRTGSVTFDGDPAARRRPMQTTILALRALGVLVDDGDRGTLPFTVHGTGAVAGGQLEIDASASSQFVSGLLLAGAHFTNGLELIHVGERLPSEPHIEMTLEALRRRGVDAASKGAGRWSVRPGPIAARESTIEPDLSNAAPFLAAALAAGGSVSIADWPAETTQVGAQLAHLLPQFGGAVTVEHGVCTATGDGSLRGADIDLSEAGELAPTLAALAMLASTPSRLRGIGHIRGHETDRLQALVVNGEAVGSQIRETEDGLAIEPAPLHGGAWKAFEDHRIATAGALIGLRTPGVSVDDIDATAKTIPEFAALWKQMLL